MPWGEQYTGATLVDMYLAELAAYAWDLARATGQTGKLDPSLALPALEGARARCGASGTSWPCGSSAWTPTPITSSRSAGGCRCSLHARRCQSPSRCGVVRPSSVFTPRTARTASAAARFFAAYAEADEAAVRRARGLAALKGLFLMLMGQNGDRGLPGGKPAWGPAGRAALDRVLSERLTRFHE
jgi:hypothetical protein